jgi:hypothetical protein
MPHLSIALMERIAAIDGGCPVSRLTAFFITFIFLTLTFFFVQKFIS